MKLRSRSLKSFFQFILISLLSFCLAILYPTPLLAQLTLPTPSTPSSDNHSNSIWNLNRTYSCGDAICSDVIIDGEKVLTVTSYAEKKEDDRFSFSADQRASKIKNTMRRIIQSRVELMANTNPLTQLKPDLSEAKEIPAKVSNLLEEKQQKSAEIPNSFQAELVRVRIGTLNGETVLYVPEQPGINRQNLLTVTRLDSLYHSQSIQDLAQQWQSDIQYQLTASIQERLEIARNPQTKIQQVLRIFFFVLALSLAIWLVQRRVRKLYRRKQRELQQLHQSLQVDPESVIRQAINPNQEPNESQSQVNRNSFSGSLWNVPLAHLVLSLQVQAFLEKIPVFTLKRQNILKQQQNLIYFIRITLFWVQLFLWFFGSAAILSLYPATRDYEQVLLIQVIFLLMIWLFVTLIDRISDFFTDYWLNRWAEEEQLTHPTDQRYSLRVNTYSPAIKKATTTLFCGLGFLSTIQLLGVPTQLLASAGLIGLLVTYFSQNLIKDFFNGALILLTDRYVMGDVIAVGNVSGVVEKLNLYITELRNLNGELITIPNGSIGTVINMTKDWSRVNFEIVVSYNSDIDQVMQILKTIAEKMQKESDWNDLFLEPLSILGVDELDYKGIKIRALIKTPPLQQWAVGREFRYRVKQAFDQMGIQIGIPQQKVYFNPEQNIINFDSHQQNHDDSSSQSLKS